MLSLLATAGEALGRIDHGDALDTARRFTAATKLQSETTSEQSIALGIDWRRVFACGSAASRSVDGVPLSDYGWLRLFGTSGKVARGEYASIVQRPGGRQKQLAARNNRIIVYAYDDDLDADVRTENGYLYYRTDTEGGSSGSPVFSDQWYVIALHRSGVPKTATRGGKAVVMRPNGKPAYEDDPEEVIAFEANEGVRISRVLAALDALADTENPQREAAVQRRDAVVRAADDVADGPFAQPVAAVPLATGGVARVPVRRSGVASAELEVVRRDLASFEDAPGYDPDFLGIPLPLPTGSVALGAEIAEADRYSFTLTNVCPQIARFNGTKEWYELERQVALGAKGKGSRVTEIVGPFLQADDPTFDSLRA